MESYFKNLEFRQALRMDTTKAHELMCLAAVIIFPIFAIFDFYTIPEEKYYFLTFIRLFISLSIGVWLYIQRVYHTREIFLTVFAFSSISLFCCYACVIGGNQYLFQHNIAYCTVFLCASLFILWHWIYSAVIVLASIIFYGVLVIVLETVGFYEVIFDGGTVVLTIMILHPVIVAVRYQSYKREFKLKQELARANQFLKEKNREMETQNSELLNTRENLNIVNKQLLEINQRLEELVGERTQSLEKKNTELQEALAELDLFLYSSYHDLKGPVARLRGLLNLAKLENEDVDQSEYFEKFDLTIQEMSNLLVKLNKVNIINQASERPERLSLSQYKIKLLDKIKEIIEGADFKIEFSGISEIIVNQEILDMILESLIENSFRFRRYEVRQSITVRIDVDSENAVITVLDNGIGISKNILPHIFKMYFRGNEQSTGHGLGLYVVKKAVEKLNGNIEVESEEGKYSLFRIQIPSKEINPRAAQLHLQ